MAQNDLSGQVTVTTAGTAVQGPDVRGSMFAFKPHHDNTDAAFIGNVSLDISNTTGFVLSVGETIVMSITNLNQLWFDTDVSGEKVTWLRID